MKKYLIILLMAVSFSVLAKSPHHDHDEVTIINKYYGAESKGVASAIAQAQCDIDRSTYSLQGCVSGGHFDSRSALNFSLGKRMNADGDLIKFSVSSEEGDLGLGVGYNWKF